MSREFFQVDYIAAGYVIFNIDHTWKCFVGADLSLAGHVCNFLNDYVEENHVELSYSKLNGHIKEVYDEIMLFEDRMNFSEKLFVDWIFDKIKEILKE